MAKITLQDVQYIAGLAQLTLEQSVQERLVSELDEILSYMDQLNALDTSGVEPMMHALPMVNVFREDEVRPSLSREETFMNAPKTDGEYFLVPKILDGEGGA